MSPRWTAGDQGATAVEYALMLSLIFAAIVTTVATLGSTLAAAFANVAAVI